MIDMHQERDRSVSPRPGRRMLRRTLLMMAQGGVLTFALLLFRLYRLQIVDHSFY